MSPQISGSRHVIFLALSLCAAGSLLSPSTIAAQQALVFMPMSEKRVPEIPPEPLFWRIENFSSVAQAQAAADRMGLVAESEGRVWLITLGSAGGASAGGRKIADVGPLPRAVAMMQRPPSQYLLRLDELRGSPGSTTAVHTYPGSEALYVLAGETSQKTPHGVTRVAAGQSIAGHSPDMPIQRLEQRRNGLACAGDVCGGCRKTIFVAGQIPMRRAHASII